MRKHTARHWLHAILDLLPVLLIPVFMIYSHRHTIDSSSIEVPVNKVIDFNQLIKPLSLNENQSSLDVELLNDYQFTINGTISSSNLWFNGNYNSTSSLGQIKKGHVYLGNNYCLFDEHSIIVQYPYNNDYLFTADNDYNITSYRLTYFASGTEFINEKITFQLFDLTQMFGSGNEPTIEQFNSWFSADYYDYTLSSKQLLKGYSTETYSDTDIMSQATYQLYNAVDKYFNMGNVFGMTNVYDWFNLNIFGGNAPISIYIVWNIVLYEFVMDLLFLLYALFMWFIDMTKRLIEKPLDSIK